MLYGIETWTIKAKDARRIKAAEMKYMRRTAGYTWTHYKTNTQTAKELKITPILDKLLEYKRNWIQHSFIDTNLIHNSYTNYIKLSSSTCFERHPLIFRRSVTLIVHVRSLWHSHSLQVAVLCTCKGETAVSP